MITSFQSDLIYEVEGFDGISDLNIIDIIKASIQHPKPFTEKQAIQVVYPLIKAEWLIERK